MILMSWCMLDDFIGYGTSFPNCIGYAFLPQQMFFFYWKRKKRKKCLRGFNHILFGFLFALFNSLYLLMLGS
jgi:hypothetical protein